MRHTNSTAPHRGWLAGLCLALTFLLATTGTSNAQNPAVPSGIVYAQDTVFLVNNPNGSTQPYYFSGTNNYYMMYKPMEMAEDIMDGMVCLNQKVVRMWFFMDGTKIHDGYNLQTSPGVYNEAGYQHMDSLMAELAARDLKCIPVFVNYWSDFGGMGQYATWAGGSAADFYSNTTMKDIYKEYVRTWLTRTNTVTGVAYKDDPTIFSWQLTNEGRSTSGTVADYVAWAGEMSTFVKSLDPHHMVSMGDEGLFNYTYQQVNDINAQRAAEGKELITNDWQYSGGQGDWLGLLDLPNIDFGTIHNYATDNWSKDLEWGKVWTAFHIEEAHARNKPCIMEEYDKAYQGVWDLTKDQERAEVMQAYTDIIYEKGMAGDCSWMLVGINTTDAPTAGYTTQVPPGCNTSTPVDQIWLYRVKWPGDGHQYSRYDPYTAPVLTAHGQRMLEKNILSAPQAFAQTTPAGGSSGVTVIPQLAWNASQYATSYSLVVSTNSNLSNPVLSVANLSSTSYSVPVADKLAYSTQYYWQVTAHNYIGSQASGAVLSFSTQAPPPPVGSFSAVTPGSSNVPVSGTVFSWSAAANADYYSLTVSASPNLANPIISEASLNGTSYTASATLAYNTNYYWSVTAHNSLSSQALSGGTQAFITQLPSPVVDNFEQYASSSAVASAWVRNPGGGDATPSLETGTVSQGAKGMKLAYSFSSYAGISKAISQSWAGYDGISFWLQGDNSGRQLLLQFQEASGEYWEQSITIGGTETVFLPFSSFANPGWGGSVNGVVDLQAISAVSFYLGGSGGAGTLYIDDVKATQQGGGGGNTLPVANAGADQTVTDADNSGSETVTLNGTASYDTDGSISSYSWAEGDSQVATGATPSVSLAVGTHTLTLTVTDNSGATASDNVVITVEAPANQLPTAQAGADQTVTDATGDGYATVALDGSASSDPDGTLDSYLWIEDGVQIASGAQVSVSLAVGTHTIQLQVRDNQGASAIDELVVTVEAYIPPPANTTYEAEAATLNGVSVASNGAASGGQYVNMAGTGSIEWAVNVPSAGNYNLVFGYLLPYGNKTQYLNVNGAYLGNVAFGGPTNTWQELTYTVSLNAGNNTVTLSKYWGYMHFDYLRVEAASGARVGTTPGRELNAGALEASLYPNPIAAGSGLSVNLNHVAEGPALFMLYNAQGQVVLRHEAAISAGATNFRVALPASVARGVYFYQLHTQGERATGQLLVE